MAWQDFYAHWGNAFGITGPFYGPQGHRGSDVTQVAAGTVIPAYRAGTVAKVQYSTFLGTEISVHADADGKFDGYCHARDGALVKVGDRVAAGTGLGYVAGFGDRHGSSWDAPHCHLTRSDDVEGVFSGPVFDPRPTVLAAVAASQAPAAPASTGGTTPITSLTEEDDMAVNIILDLGPEHRGRMGVYPVKNGFSLMGSTEEVEAFLRAEDVTGVATVEDLTAKHVRGVSSRGFDLIAARMSS